MAVTDTLADYFEFEEHGTDLRTEIIAGITTFLAMSYIIVVNPAVLSEAISVGENTFQMLAVVTIIASVAAMLVMAFYANLPFGLAPGMGLNAFFVVVVTQLEIPWETALAAVLIEGLLFIGLTAVGAREYVIKLFPEPIKLAIGAGIGLFLALLGLEQMRVITQTETINPLIGTDPIAILAVAGIIVTFALWARDIQGSIVLGILSTSVAAYVVSALGVMPAGNGGEDVLLVETATLAPGLDNIAFDFAAFDISPLAFAFVDGLQNVEGLAFALVIFTFFFVDFFDTAGTLTGLGHAADLTDESGNLPEMNKPLMADAVGTTVGGILGTSTVTTYIESSTGIGEGGRTGMTALVVAGLFLITLPVVPLLDVIPSFAPYIALVVVAVMMLQNITDINWGDTVHAVPAGLTIIIMPLTQSIAYGIAAGLLTYPIVAFAADRREEVHPAQWIMALVCIGYFAVRFRVLV
ncbi:MULTISPECIES: NCS2 family permease [unclassified Halorhabdus]|uniref:NCS2 family permease n=1 Tax=unclassified Halorhabdus TaxID=2621901 RepID=UPI0023DA07A6|nr:MULTISPECIES: NCS2 family permease [unclassified Halorhabdus]WEL18912.1 Xanthine/uracil/vitamin C permease, AzgA family [Halorhabdus sp. SVX81]WEL22744.1 Xanthine/uracil/vitamin C permease, AzgA family [Halorhabdus sp. BNX81]